jgi:hypothetical protein
VARLPVTWRAWALADVGLAGGSAVVGLRGRFGCSRVTVADE